MFPKVQTFLIEARTGCSCCESENFWAGPYLKEEDAVATAESFRRQARLASQYSKTGIYYIHPHEAEQLPDGRLIIGNQIWGPDYQERGGIY